MTKIEITKKLMETLVHIAIKDPVNGVMLCPDKQRYREELVRREFGRYFRVAGDK